MVSGELLGEKIHIVVIHWPSRRGGESRCRPKRIAAANLSKSIVDSLQQINKRAKVIIMGDFNDDYFSKYCRLLKARRFTFLKNNQMYNTMYHHYKKIEL